MLSSLQWPVIVWRALQSAHFAIQNDPKVRFYWWDTQKHTDEGRNTTVMFIRNYFGKKPLKLFDSGDQSSCHYFGWLVGLIRDDNQTNACHSPSLRENDQTWRIIINKDNPLGSKASLSPNHGCYNYTYYLICLLNSSFRFLGYLWLGRFTSASTLPVLFSLAIQVLS